MNIANSIGIILMFITAILLSVFSVIVKEISSVTSLMMEVFVYYFIPLLIISPFAIKNELYKTQIVRWHILRSVFATGSIMCFFYAARTIQLGLAVLLYNTIPIFVPLLAKLCLKEKITLKIYFGIFISLLGIIVVLDPRFSHANYYSSFLGILSGFLMACATVIMKQLTIKKESVTKIVFQLYLFSSITAIIVILITVGIDFHYKLINIPAGACFSSILIYLVGLGVLSIVAQITFTKASHYLMVSKQAPFLFLSVLVSSLLGWIIWKQAITSTVIGGGILIFIGIYIVIFEKSKEKFKK
jgi:drug/metabolite transporter (DMT)-like permease